MSFVNRAFFALSAYWLSQIVFDMFDLGIQMSKFGTCIATSKLPGDGTARAIALHLQSIDASAQVSHTVGAARKTATLKNADLNFGHIQPTAVFGSVMKLSPPQNASRLFRRECFIERGRGMG